MMKESNGTDWAGPCPQANRGQDRLASRPVLALVRNPATTKHSMKTQIASKTNTNRTWLILLVAAALAGPVLKAGGDTPYYIQWTGAAKDLLWSTASNWDSNTVPTLNWGANFQGAVGTNVLGAVNNIVPTNMNVMALRYGCVSNSSRDQFPHHAAQAGRDPDG